MTNCPVCGTPMPDTSFGPYCPNKTCQVADDALLWAQDDDGEWFRRKVRRTTMKIDATSPDGNAYVIMGMVRRLLYNSGRGDEWEGVLKKMTSGDYKNLCAVAEEVTHGAVTVVNVEKAS